MTHHQTTRHTLPARTRILLLAALAATTMLVACTRTATTQAVADTRATARLQAVAALFDDGALAAAPTLVDCELSGGAKAVCAALTVYQAPQTVSTGPWCPRQVSDGADKGGIWLDRGQVHPVDGAFVQNLARFYGDATWQMFDPATGRIRVTDTRASCDAAARPDVDPRYRNYCVECQTSYLTAGATVTYVIPLEPVAAPTSAAPAGRLGPGPVGLALTGVRMDAPAPVDAILGAHTIAPFDDCGGHVNLHVGYHMHAVTDCLTQRPASQHATRTTGHAQQIGIAMDGYAIHARLDASGADVTGLDACRGHRTDALGYHYHAAAPGANAILACHVAQTGCALDEGRTSCDASAYRRGPPGGRLPGPQG